MSWRKDGSLLGLNGNRETFLVQDNSKPTLFISAYCSEPADVVWYEQCVNEILATLQAKENIVTCGRGHKIPTKYWGNYCPRLTCRIYRFFDRIRKLWQ